MHLAQLILLVTPMVNVPAGRFTMGSETGDRDERPVRQIRLPAFAIDKTEVTRAAYLVCVKAGVCQSALLFPNQTDPALPQTGVSYEDSSTYCRFVGKRLPTEAEWEKSARGTDGRMFPWGNQPDCRRANYGVWAKEGPCADPGVSKNAGVVLPVGSFTTGASPYGALDLAGNVWEWVSTPFKLPSENRTRRVLKGGSCCSTFLEPRLSNRVAYEPGYRDFDIGFRCAKDIRDHNHVF